MTFAKIFVSIAYFLAVLGAMSVLGFIGLLVMAFSGYRKTRVADGEAERVIDGFVPEDIGA